MASPCYPSQLQDPKFSNEESRDIWNYARVTYIDKGVEISDTIKNVATDLGLKPEWVAKAFTEPKAIRSITNEMYKKMSDRRRVVQDAKDIVNGLDKSPIRKVFDTIWRTPFAIAVAGHGTVGMQTHAGAALFRPSTWNTYFTNFGRQYKYSYNKAAHEAAMQELVRDPNFITAKRAGLANDPSATYTDYGVYAKWIPKVLGKAIGQRGFDVLKKYRQDAFNNEWSKVSESIKSDPQATKDLAKNLAEMINHSSGVADIGHGPVPTGISTLTFAARLEASRWARIIGDPIKTVGTFTDWKNSSAADRHVAVIRLRHAAEFTGFYVATLIANQAMLSASGSKDQINFTDPSKSDWLRHKIAGRTIGLEGNLMAPIRLLGQLIYNAFGPRQPYQRMESRFESETKTVGGYVRGKLSPAAGIAVDVATQSDFMGNPLPFSKDKPKAGKHQLAIGEYLGQRGPIPLSGAIREVYDNFKEQGMDAATATNLIRGLAVLGAETTGAKVGMEPKPKSKRNTFSIVK
jgi:hypothetical protein